MNLRRPLLAAAGLVGGSVALHRLLKRRAGTLEPPLPGDRHTYRWRGMDVAYTEAGDPDDPDLLLYHGIHAAASSREWKPTFQDLARDYHVIAPDLPGYGCSDRPPIDYDADLYADFVRDFAVDLAPGAACVASSLTGAYVALAQREAGPFDELVLICPTGRTGIGRPALGSVVRAPVVGTALFDVLASKPSLRYFSARMSFADPGAVDESDVDYDWRSAHQPGARYAPAAFVGGEMDVQEDLATILSTIDVPVSLVWGRESDIPPLSEGRLLAEEADARLVVFDRARLLPHVEYPEQFVETVRESLRRAQA